MRSQNLLGMVSIRCFTVVSVRFRGKLKLLALGRSPRVRSSSMPRQNKQSRGAMAQISTCWPGHPRGALTHGIAVNAFLNDCRQYTIRNGAVWLFRERDMRCVYIAITSGSLSAQKAKDTVVQQTIAAVQFGDSMVSCVQVVY